MAGFGYNTNSNSNNPIAMNFGSGDMNMAFGFEQAADPSFAKVAEGNTSADFLFADDEGIDTTTSSFLDPLFSMSTADTSFSMPQNLALDNTLGSSATWNNQLVSGMDSFPMTPVQSFGSINQFQSVNEMGKRPLELDVNDFPQSKRHESHASASFSPFIPSSSASMAGSSWIETQATPASSVDVTGLSDEAADVCALWFSKYAVLPSDRHIDSLSQLTGEPASAIRQWFGRLLKQGMAGHADSAYRSQTSFTQQEQPFRNSTQSYTVPEAPSNQESNTTTASPPTARGGKKGCTPTQDADLLRHDPIKIYQCTRKCGKRYTRKCDWKRNEEEWYPSKSWLCSLCVSQGTNDKLKPCFRRYHFSQHFRNLHPNLDSNDYEASSLVLSDTEFPRRCGFCPHRFASRQDRIDHIADHFKKGKGMIDWVDYEEDNSPDNTDDDDDDDKPDNNNKNNHSSDSNGSNGSRSGSQGRGSKQGDNNDGGSGNGQSSFSGFGHFQLSTSQDNTCSVQSTITDSLQQFNGSDVAGNHSLGSGPYSETAGRLATESYSTLAHIRKAQQDTLPGRSSTTRDDAATVAGNAVTDVIGRTHPSQDQFCITDSYLDSTQGLTQTHAGQHSPDQQTRSSVNQSSTLQEIPRGVEGVCERTSRNDNLQHALETKERPQFQAKVSEVQLQTQKDSVAVGTLPSHSPTPPLPPPIPDYPKRAPDQDDSVVKKTSDQAAADLQWREIGSLSVDNFVDHQSFLSVKLLGTGGFSTVDEVIHQETKLRMSRKTLKNREQSAMDELKNEVNVLKKLRHPHIVRFLGAYAKGDKVSILCSPVAETTLALWLKQSMRERPVGLQDTIFKMFGCLASTLRYLHEQRPIINHLDIKPQNILVTLADGEEPRVILSDFGISSSTSSASQTTSKALTRQYSAPEVFSGKTRESATDIWSLGCVFIEMTAAALCTSNRQWLDLLEQFTGSHGKLYWQEVPRLHQRLSSLLEQTASPVEANAVRTIKTMVDPEPSQRPSAAMLTMVFTPALCCLQWANDEASFPGPQQELASVEALVQQDHSSLAQRHVFSCGFTSCKHRSNAQQDVDARVKGWVEECVHDHEACAWNDVDGTTLPTRLVDINAKQADGLSSLRVVNSADIASGSDRIDYVVVSHMWSPSDLTLSKDNIHQAQTQLSVESLSDALKEAVATAERVGYRYIWADSLCIVQDSEEDKHRECAAMAATYRNAALTIVVDDVNAHTGPNHKRLSTANVDTADSDDIVDWQKQGFAWDTRAWSLQERLLSRRLLRLAGEQVYWECNNLKASETFPHGLPSLLWEKAHMRMATIPGTKTNSTTKTTKISGSSTTPQQCRLLRDCMWLKKEGNDIADAVASQIPIALQDKPVQDHTITMCAVADTSSSFPDAHISSSFQNCEHLDMVTSRNEPHRSSYHQRMSRSTTTSNIDATGSELNVDKRDDHVPVGTNNGVFQ
ncbi:hypothetical protein BU24DRAFT_420789 [Aaosphaeria arxii CBS 175.79]|uniref:Protein kinase domain-containing protein n=1 Tax=Aaosphaeria arxii CBS 175.79 TaxID=1450172 RepID=A0A6A5XYF4_9PLEO|nr:uncharacterized protein BU24DRAFT_420789 [Aaosphaeria arxii CBS 175.79]KAF2017741.1 hypothetical protein BU24DRAFT_420789 [Aaosphaeria arxii CBS 175.79]